MTAAERMERHLQQRNYLLDKLKNLVTGIEAAALLIHDELEEFHQRLDAIELREHDPAAHGRKLQHDG